MKREDNRAEIRAKNFLSDNGANLRKGGTIEKKDLSKLIVDLLSSNCYEC